MKKYTLVLGADEAVRVLAVMERIRKIQVLSLTMASAIDIAGPEIDLVASLILRMEPIKKDLKK